MWYVVSDTQAESLLPAEVRLGELLDSIKPQGNTLTSSGGRKVTLPLGISHKDSHIAQALASNQDTTEARYGETYTKLLDETDYSYQTLSHTKYVSKQFEFIRRRINLSWAHHYEVASLPPEEADELLRRAEVERVGVRTTCHNSHNGVARR